MAVTKKIIGRIPICFGTWYAKQGGWGIKNRVTLYGSEFESLHENNTVPPAVYDEIENTVTFNENDWRVISNGTEAWLADAKIDALGTWEENPEFVEVCFDKNGRIIYGAQRNGNFVFGAGVPEQIKEYFKEHGGDLIHDIEAFLAGFDGDETLKEYLDENYGTYEENPEFVEVKLDANGCVLWGIRKDSDIVFGCGIPSEIQNALNKITNDINDNFGDIKGTFHYVTSPEYLFACLDAEDKFLYGVTIEGKFRAADLEFDLPEEEAKWLNTVFSLIKDPEGRVDITLDANNKLLSWRDGEGVKHETNLAIENSLELSDEAMTDFQQALKDAGFNPGGGGDFSDTITNKGKNPVYIPTPRCAMLNILSGINLTTLSKSDRSDGVQKVNYDVKVQCEFFDGQGIYFKKWALIGAQGNSSMAFEKKNISIKWFDTENVENSKGKWGKGDTFGTVFGDWVMQKTYHLKAYHTDFIRGSSVVSYQLCDQILKTRGNYADKVWKKALINFDDLYSDYLDTHTGKELDDLKLQVDNGARCYPDGFPVIVYQNGKFYGIFAWQLKKDADNMCMDTGNPLHIHIDGDLTVANLWDGSINWSGFEVRNPEKLISINGEDYNGDFPSELIGSDSIYYQKGFTLNGIPERYTGGNIIISIGADTYTIATTASMGVSDIIDAIVAGNYTTSDYTCYKSGNTAVFKDTASRLTPPDVTVESVGAVPLNFVNRVISVKYNPSDKNHVRSNTVKQYIIDLSNRVGQINTLNATDSEAAKDLFDTYFDADNLVDYEIGNLAVNDTDAFAKNWQWTTYDGVKWYANFYDKDMSFGNHFIGGKTTPVPAGGWIGNNKQTPMGWLIEYYQDELVARWKELRTKGILTYNNIFGLVQKWVSRIGYDNYRREYKKWTEAPCNRDSNIDTEYWKLINPIYTSTSGDDWNPNTNYEYHSLCTRNNHLYYSQRANIGVDPATDDGTNWQDLTWNPNESYSEGATTWYGHSRDHYQFEAVKASNNSNPKPPITKFYTKFPYELGYHDSIWRYSKYIDELMQNINNFIDSL